MMGREQGGGRRPCRRARDPTTVFFAPDNLYRIMRSMLQATRTKKIKARKRTTKKGRAIAPFKPTTTCFN